MMFEDARLGTPATRGPLARYRTGIPVLVLVLMLVSGALSCSRKSVERSVEAQSAGKPIPVHLAKVESRDIRRNVESVGSLFPLEEVTVSSEVEGRVERVLVDVGDRVTEGQPLVTVSPVELKLSLDQQRASLQQARARLGLPAGVEDLADVRDAAEVKKASADLHDADQKYQRAKSLLDQGLVPRDSYDETDAHLKAMRAAYDLAIQSVQNLRAQMAQIRASVELAQKKLADAVIRAPFAGLIRERFVTQGQYLKVQTSVMAIVSTDVLRVRLKVPEKMAGWIRSGQSVSLSVEAYPDKSFTGKLSRINPSVDQQTRSFEVEALIENPQLLLKPGFFVKAQIPSEKVERTLVIPKEALLYSFGIYKVFTVAGRTLKETEVHIGEGPGQMVEILDGLNEGQGIALAVKGSDLKDGADFEVVAGTQQ